MTDTVTHKAGSFADSLLSFLEQECENSEDVEKNVACTVKMLKRMWLVQ